ncbi:MAG: hypothetical protein D6685_00160 [Bacteroidetes bacterium]|nr:hypothetical protein AWN76_000810 [Rhodothermaceae bacterium RA]RMH70321.1 MAG: hypothetical protein D6685_00160 [Bacteroidota bacterium]
MAEPDTLGPLRQLAYLYLVLAHGSDDYLTSAELDVIVERLGARRPDLDPAEVQDIVTEALAAYLDAEEPHRPALEAVIALRDHLTPAQRRAVLEDLVQIARADGLVLDDERALLLRLASHWDINLDEYMPPRLLTEGSRGDWGVLHHLAYLYLVLAYGTDHTLSPDEIRVMLARLRARQPRLAEEEVRAILSTAMEQYARGPTEERILAAVTAVRDGLPEAQRQAALDDLVQIANADGVFLDDEEDLINYLTEAWGVSAFAGPGSDEETG